MPRSTKNCVNPTALLSLVILFATSAHAQLTRAQQPPAPTRSSAPKVAPAAPAFSTEAERCIIPASTYHGINPWILRTVLFVESSLNPAAFGKNTNGTIDIGIGQINSMHLPELKKYGIESAHLTDACICTYVSGWYLKKAITERGNTWEGIASYHSRTPAFNQKYQRLLINELQRSQALAPRPASMPTPMTMQAIAGQQSATSYGFSPNTYSQQQARSTKPADIDTGMLVFDQP